MTNTACVNFLNWILEANPGSKYVYYEGTHLTDTILSLEIKKVSWKYACEGKIHLYRKRIYLQTGKTSLFEYIAEKASPNLSELHRKILVPLETAAEYKKTPKHHFRKWQTEIGAYNG